MKVLAGRFGGRKIITSKNLSYRPTKSLVRKSLFDHLTPFKYNSVLDLFSGSGILGFEAGSRGADSIVFVEKDQEVLRYLKQNSDLLVGPQYSFHGLDAFKYLEKKRENFNLNFAYPPYSKYYITRLFEQELEHLNKKGKFILECDKTQVPFLEAVVKDYGQTRILYWENA
ncbi:MAG: RsmD family RNA methyltransferase [Candidatus Neomarinimicrobiota bacterium]